MQNSQNNNQHISASVMRIWRTHPMRNSWRKRRRHLTWKCLREKLQLFSNIWKAIVWKMRWIYAPWLRADVGPIGDYQRGRLGLGSTELSNNWIYSHLWWTLSFPSSIQSPLCFPGDSTLCWTLGWPTEDTFSTLPWYGYEIRFSPVGCKQKWSTC